MWCPLGEREITEIAALAARVLAADGGLPLAAEPSFLIRRYTGAGTRAWGVRDETGTLVAAGAVRPGNGGPVATGMVDPAARGRGLGAGLLDWALAMAADQARAGGAERPGSATGPGGGTPPGSVTSSVTGPGGGTASGPVTVETESLTPGAVELFGTRGLHQVFAEDVMRFDLAGGPRGTALPEVRLPDGVHLEEWSAATVGRFHAVYAAAFAERPNTPGWSAERWASWLADDDDFRPGWTLLAVDGEAGDVAFVACAVGWIIQVGVRPDHRGRRLGAGLVGEALRRMRAAGQGEAYLDVNVDNPAGRLYRRLGFAVIGRRARFAAGPIR